MTVSLDIGRESDFLKDVLRFAVTAALSSNGTEHSAEDGIERRRKLVEGVRWNRKFVPTYHFIVLGVICILSVAQWTSEFGRWRRRRTPKHLQLKDEPNDIHDENDRPRLAEEFLPQGIFGGQESDEIFPSSSGSSTIDGTSSPPSKELDHEQTPLLNSRAITSSLESGRTIVSTFKAFLVYQPRPIPIFNKVLPPNGTSLAIIAFVALNGFYTFYRISFESHQSFVLSDRAGILFAVNLPYLYILAAKNQPIKLLTGRSYESLNLFHRRLGELLCLQAFIHGTAMMIAWYNIIRPNGYTLIMFLTRKLIIYGLITFFAYELLYFTSLASFRQRWYELFLGSHIILQAVALLFLYLHHPTGRPYVLASLFIFLTDRLIYRANLKRTSAESLVTIMEDDETVKLSTEIVLQPARLYPWMFRKSIREGWKATDHVFITIPSLAPRHMLQSHPFTIASRAPTSNDETARLELLIRARDGFSADLLMRARSHRQMTVLFDGPYGSAHARDTLENKDLALMIAGGSGIAVLWPLVHHLLKIHRSSDVEVSPTRSPRTRIVIIWVVHKGEHIDWLGRSALADAENRGVEIIVPRATEEIGRPDLEGIIRQITGQVVEKGGCKARIGVVTSGPDSMSRQVRNNCASLVGEGLYVDVTVEKFGW